MPLLCFSRLPIWRALAAWLNFGLTATLAAETIAFDIPAAMADKSLQQFSLQSGAELVYPAEIVRGVKTAAIKGDMEIAEALRRLLDNTGLRHWRDPNNQAFIISRDLNDARASQSRMSDRPANPAPSANSNPPNSTIEGRVLNLRSGSYVEGARVIVVGTSLETFTDADGGERGGRGRRGGGSGRWRGGGRGRLGGGSGGGSGGGLEGIGLTEEG